MGEKEKEKYKKSREKLMADPEKYQAYLEKRRMQRKQRQKELEPRPPLPGESIEQTREKYNRKTEKAIKKAERDRKTK